MKAIKAISGLLAGSMFLSGCATMQSKPEGSSGPELTHSYSVDGQTQYVQVGVKFTSTGDLVALVNPNRWKNPLAPGGSISWMNPAAWRHDWGRTGRIFLGEAALIGVGAAAAGGGGGGGGGGGVDPTEPQTPPPSGNPSGPPPPPVG